MTGSENTVPVEYSSALHVRRLGQCLKLIIKGNGKDENSDRTSVPVDGGVLTK